MRCSRCGADLVEVDNPFRKEFRHRRGVECAASEAALEVPEPHIMAPDSAVSGHDHTDGAYLPSGPGKEVSRYADAAMFRSEPMPYNADGRVVPTAYLLNATPDPLGSLAALNAIYTGGVYRSLADVTDDMRREALVEVRKNKLQGPLESINFHFLLEGVSRSFTHQLVRGRRAFYAQESLRFAVVEGDPWTNRVAVPPNYQLWAQDQQDAWEDATIASQNAYQHLVNSGVPAEDARGLMPHAMTTRVHWVVTLRELLYVAGVRLTTQAQFEWRSAIASVVNAIRKHAHSRDGFVNSISDGWQFEDIAELLRPICFQEGKCGFKAKADRSCTIRDRVDAHEAKGEHPSTWDDIDPREWLLDPNAAR